MLHEIGRGRRARKILHTAAGSLEEALVCIQPLPSAQSLVEDVPTFAVAWRHSSSAHSSSSSPSHSVAGAARFPLPLVLALAFAFGLALSLSECETTHLSP